MTKDEYLITDPPLKALTVFAMPMILGSFFQQVYNMADSIIVGQFVGSSALAAVGACAALTNVFICIALGAGVGAGVLVSRNFGAQNYGKMKTIISTSLISFLLLSIFLGIFGVCSAHWMMRTLQTPADIMEEAVLYLRIYFAGFPFLFMYNILSTMFTSIGESKIPLWLLIFSSVLNIIMDLWMVGGLKLGVFGAALATLIAQGISAVLSLLIFLYRMRKYASPFHWFDKSELRSMLKIAVPSVLQQSTVSIGMMIVQAVVNPFGTQALAGYAATMRVETVVLLSHKKADSYIHIDVEFGEGEGKIPVDSIAKRAEAYKPKEKVTYKMIKEYIEAKYGFKVHTAYIAEVKRNLGLPMYDAPNAVEELKQPRKHPTPEKVEAIKDALRYFAVI